jgi:hypothetical protein
MNQALLFHAARVGKVEEKLLKVIEEGVPNCPLEICLTTKALERRLRGPVFDIEAAVLLAESGEAFQKIVSLRELLQDLKVILITPDSNQATLVKGHLLKPRFMCDRRSDFAELTAVLQRLVSRKRQRSGHC